MYIYKVPLRDVLKLNPGGDAIEKGHPGNTAVTTQINYVG